MLLFILIQYSLDSLYGLAEKCELGHSILNNPRL